MQTLKISYCIKLLIHYTETVLFPHLTATYNYCIKIKFPDTIEQHYTSTQISLNRIVFKKRSLRKIYVTGMRASKLRFPNSKCFSVPCFSHSVSLIACMFKIYCISFILARNFNLSQRVEKARQ